jgi:hypothetical protein
MRSKLVDTRCNFTGILVGKSDMSRVVRSVITIVDIYYGSNAPVNVQNRAP